MEKIQKSYNSVKSSIENKVLKGQINAYEDFPGLKGVSDGTFVIAFLFCNYKNVIIKFIFVLLLMIIKNIFCIELGKYEMY